MSESNRTPLVLPGSQSGKPPHERQGLNLQWITEPPIVVLQDHEVAPRLKMLEQNMAGWDPVAVPDQPSDEDIDQRDWKTPKRSQQERWNDRLEATREMLGKDFSASHVVEYRFASGPIGMMALITVSPTYIADLVTHPGSEQAGGILIEYAVQKSEEWGEHGKLELFALTDDALKAYEALGFAVTSGSKMVLDPASRPDIWVKQHGVLWRLVKFQTTSAYLTSGGKPLPKLPGQI